MVSPMSTTPLILSPPSLRDFLEIPYDELEELNLEAKDARIKRKNPDKVQEERMKYLSDEKRIKAVTVCFTDLEGRMHMLDSAAAIQRAMMFAKDKDHPEVAPSQFEMNFNYADAVIGADQVQLYKLLSRQVAAQMGLTACFLPKPVTGVNGNGMHTNMSLNKGGRNLFHDKNGQDGLSALGWDFIDRILNSANDICLALNPSVNAYRRLDTHYEAPNQIKAS